MSKVTYDQLLSKPLKHKHSLSDLPPALDALGVTNTEDITLTLTVSELTANLANNPTANNLTINDYFYFER